MSTDSDIVRASLEHPEAFAALFDSHADAIGAFAARRIGREAAEDVVSESFLVAFRRRRDFDLTSSSARPWLFGIAARLIRRHRAVEARHWKSVAAAAARGDHITLGEVDHMLSRVDAERDAAALSERIARLAPRDRDVLLLHAWAGMSYEEVAFALDVPVGTIRSRLNRVRTRLDPDRRKQAFLKQEKGESSGRV